MPVKSKKKTQNIQTSRLVLFLNSLDRAVAWRSKKREHDYISMAALTVCTLLTFRARNSCFFFLHRLNCEGIVNGTKLGRLLTFEVVAAEQLRFALFLVLTSA